MWRFWEKPRRYRSAFGGLWIDREDAEEHLARRLAENAVSATVGRDVAQFMADGYVILPGAVEAGLADRIASMMTAAYTHGDARLRYQADGPRIHTLERATAPRGARIIEAHAVVGDVREAFCAPPVVKFLSAIFEETPLLSQSLLFQMGSEQRYHRDTTFVRFDEPLRMAGCWIALEDVRPGSGELRYIAGSHCLPDFPFSNGRKDGIGVSAAELESSLQWIVAESEKRLLVERVFSARKGDVLIWHADLVHGGCAITCPDATRQSLVGHLSPLSVGRAMHPGSRIRRWHGPICYSSTYYDVQAPL